MKRLTIQQRQALLKGFCLVLALGMFIGSLCAVPCIVGAVPRMSGTNARDFLHGTEAAAKDVPAFALGGGFEFSQEDESFTESEDISKPEESQNEMPEKPSSPKPKPNDLFVTASNLCWYEIGETPTLNIINRTGFSVELKKYLEREFPVKGKIPTSDPLVLIIHTHGSESYLPAGQGFYSPDESFRSFDEEKTVVHIGEVLAERLNSLGIPTLHDKTMHDKADYNTSYVASSKAIEKYLAENPSIKFVIDLHRDSVFDSEGNNIKPLTTIKGKDCAQLMLVVGTNEAGIPHPNWQENLTFATHLQQKMNDMFPTLARPLNLRTAEFNQSYTKGSIILEVGSCGNTVEEAENAILNFANAYASMLKEELG